MAARIRPGRLITHVANPILRRIRRTPALIVRGRPSGRLVTVPMSEPFDNLRSGPQTEAAVVGVHLVIGVASFALLAFLLAHARPSAPMPERPGRGAPPPAQRKEDDQ
jgi:hypothetical protein